MLLLLNLRITFYLPQPSHVTPPTSPKNRIPIYGKGIKKNDLYQRPTLPKVLSCLKKILHRIKALVRKTI